MFTLNFSLAFPKEESLYCSAPRWGGGCGFRRRVFSFPAPLPGTFTPLAVDSCSESLAGRLLGPGPACASACGSHTLQNFLSLTLHEGVRSLGSGEWRVRMQVPGLTKQSERSACVLCTSGGAGEPAQQPSGRLGDSWETEAVESGSGIFKWMFGCRFWGKVNRGGYAQASQLVGSLLPMFNRL